MGKQVRMDILDIDKYKRMVAVIWIGNRNISLEMVKEGYADAYLEYLREPYRAEFIGAEKKAKIHEERNLVVTRIREAE